MKLIYKILLLSLVFINLNAGDIYVEKHPNKADIKVYIAEFPLDADIWVYIEESSLFAKDHDEYWYFVKHPNLADVSIYFVKHPNLADVSVYFVTDKIRAQWKTTDSRFLTKFK